MRSALLFLLLMIVATGLAQPAITPFDDDYSEGDAFYDSLYAVQRARQQAAADSARLAEVRGRLDALRTGRGDRRLVITNAILDTLGHDLRGLSGVRHVGFVRCEQLDLAQVLGVLATWPDLRSLTLADGSYDALPEAIGRLAGLDTLVLRGNDLRMLPDSLAMLQNIAHLDLSHNLSIDDRAVWAALVRLPAALHVDLSYCRMSIWPDDVRVPTRAIDLSGNFFTTVHPSIAGVEDLGLASNADVDVTRLMADLATFTRLRRLDLSANGITALPAGFGNLSKLEVLKLSDNELTTLPDDIGACSELRVLDISNTTDYRRGNQLSALPSSIGRLAALEELYAARNLLADLPESIGECRSLRILDLSINQLTAFPPALTRCTKLEQVLMAENTIATLPEQGMGHLDALEILDLRNFFFVWPDQKISTLPDDLCGMAALRELYLGDHVIEELPDSIGRLTTLEVLDVRNNLLSDLPESIGRLSALEVLDLKTNELTDLPASFSDLASLRDLDLAFNAGLDEAAVLDELVDLPALERIDISFNEFTVSMVDRLRAERPGVEVTAVQFE